MPSSELYVVGTSVGESGTSQLFTVGEFQQAVTLSEDNAVAMSASTFAVRAWQVLDITSDENNHAVLTLLYSQGTRQVTVSNLTVEQATEKINRSEYHGNEILAREYRAGAAGLHNNDHWDVGGWGLH